jgi:hypothetical protein
VLVIVMIVVVMAVAAVVVNPRPMMVRAAHSGPFKPDRCTIAAVQQQSFRKDSGQNPWNWAIWASR